MIFQHTHEMVLSGRKTQTRRAIKLNDTFVWYDSVMYVSRSGKGERFFTPYQTCKTYAVQPGRGKKAIARIEITEIRREDVREISDEDVVAEGFTAFSGFIKTWIKMHDPKAHLAHQIEPMTSQRTFQWMSEGRPPKLYQAWALTFRLVEGGTP